MYRFERKKLLKFLMIFRISYSCRTTFATRRAARKSGSISSGEQLNCSSANTECAPSTSDVSSPSVPIGLQSTSQELLLQGTSQVQQAPPLFSTAHTAVSTSQPPIQPTCIPSWDDEVATAEQSGHFTPETVIPN